MEFNAFETLLFLSLRAVGFIKEETQNVCRIFSDIQESEMEKSDS